MKWALRSDQRPRSATCIAVLGLTALAADAATAGTIAGTVVANTTPITINDSGPASVYPSTITVSGIDPRGVVGVFVQLHGFTHARLSDLDLLLVGPRGQRVMLMSDAFAGIPANYVDNDNVRFSPVGSRPFSSFDLRINQNAAFNVSTPDPIDSFPAPGPGDIYAADSHLDVFDLGDPNGTWSLYVVDDQSGEAGAIAGGWDLRFSVPTIFTVTTTADSDDGACSAQVCSLRDAISAAGDFDLIRFSPLFDQPQIITLDTALPTITHPVSIAGPGMDRLTVRRSDTAAAFPVLSYNGSFAAGVTLQDLTLSNGSGDLGGGVSTSANVLRLARVRLQGNHAISGGGAGVVAPAGQLRMVDCKVDGNTASSDGGGLSGRFELLRTTVANNQAPLGAGINVVDSVVVSESSVVGNVAGVRGGAIRVGQSGRLAIDNSTISGNSAGAGIGGGIVADTAATVSLEAVTIAGNTAASGAALMSGSTSGSAPQLHLHDTLFDGNVPTSIAPPDSHVQVISDGFNLANDTAGGVLTQASDHPSTAPLLGPLRDNGGGTFSHYLQPGSPAIDAGQGNSLIDGQRDQLAAPRRQDTPGVANAVGGDATDIGAVEFYDAGPLFVDGYEDP